MTSQHNKPLLTASEFVKSLTRSNLEVSLLMIGTLAVMELLSKILWSDTQMLLLYELYFLGWRKSFAIIIAISLSCFCLYQWPCQTGLWSECSTFFFFFNNLIPLNLSDNPIRLPAKTWSSFCIHISYYHFLFCFLRYNLHYVVYAEIGTVCTLITFMIHFSVDETLPARGQCLTLARNQRSQHQPHIPQSDSPASPPQHGSLPSLFLLLHSAVTLQKASLWVFPVVFW